MMAYLFRFLWLLAALLLPVCASAVPQVQIQDSVTLPNTEINGVRLSELSGLAWDADEQLLYAISDQGAVFHFQLEMAEQRIAKVEPVFAAKLQDIKGKVLKKGRGDAEGLTLLNAANGKRGDTQLVISLEGEARIVRFTPQGQAIQNIALPVGLRNQPSLHHSNRGLESLTLHPRYGFITAPERPLKGQAENLHTLFSTSGKQWSFIAYPAEKSGISALEALPDGNLLILERAWSGFPNPLVISLRYLDFAACSREGMCEAQDLYVNSSFVLLDNYEGLTHLAGDQYLMVSDDGGGDWQRTELTLFSLD